MTITGPQPDEPNYFVLIAPGADSNDPTPPWTDVSTDLRSVRIRRGADKHLDEDQPGETTIVLDNFHGAYDNDNGPMSQHVDLPGTAGNYISTPDSAAVLITEDLDVRVWVALDDVTPAAEQVLISKYLAPGDQRSWSFSVNAAGTLKFRGSSNGDATLDIDQNSGAPSLSDGVAVWLRATYVSGSGLLSFYKSSDGTSWATISSGAVAAISLFDSTAELQVGAINGALNLAGKVYYAEVRNGIDGPIVAAFDAQSQPHTADQVPNTVAGPLGEVWTINGTGWAWGGTWAPYFGQLITDMRVRVLAEWDGELYERFNGYLDDIELEYPDDGEAWAILRATDAFKVLAGAELPSSAYVAEVLADGPEGFWRLDEPEGSTTVFDSSGNRHHLTVSGAPDFGETGLVSREPGSATKLATTSDGMGTTNPITTSAPLTVEMVFSLTADSPNVFIMGQLESGTGPGWALHYEDIMNRFRFLVGPPTTAVDSTTVVVPGQTYHVVAVWRADGTLKLYVNGNDVSSTLESATPFSFAGTFAIGRYQIASGASSTIPGTYQMVAIYDYELSADRIAAHAAAVATPWNFDIPSQRAHRICDLIGWPDILRDFEEGIGQTTLQSAELAGETALEHLLKVAASEFGELHVTKEGAIKLVARHSLINREPLAFFGPADDEIRYRGIRFSSGSDLVRNPVTVSRNEGVAQTVEAPAGYYPHQFTLDGLLHSSDELSRDAAEFLLSEFKDQKRRIAGVTFGPFDGERLYDWFPVLLEAELGDVYQVTFTPPNGDDLVQVSVLEGTEEFWSADTGIGEVSWSLSRAYAGGGAFWQLGVRGRSELGLTTRLYF